MRFFWKSAETELEREISHHLHELAAEYQRQGQSREEALRLARREFGGGEQVKEQCRDERAWAWMTGVRQDLLFGWRMMRRTPMVTLAAVISLALGIGANTAIVSLMDVVLWRDLPVPYPAQLNLVHWQGHGVPRELIDTASGSMNRDAGWDVADFFSYPSFELLRSSLGTTASLAAFTYPGPVSVSFEGRPVVAQERPVGGNFLSTLQVRPQAGRLFSDSDDADGAPATVILSHRFWVRVLGSEPGIIGRTISINHEPHVIVGVLEPGFYGLFPGDPSEVYTPLHRAAWLQRLRSSRRPLQDKRAWIVSLLARRSPGSTPDQARRVMDGVFPSTWSRQPKDPSSMPRIRLDPGGRGLGLLRAEFRNPLILLGALVALLLIIACVNIANLLLARASARQPELAARVSLGCSQGRLMRQLFTESLLLASLGGAASIGVAYATADLLGRFVAGNERVPVTVSLDFRILAIVGTITAAALLLFGIFPAWQASRQSHQAWRGGSSSVHHGGRIQWSAGGVLVVSQMAMSVVLVMSAVTFTRNLLAIRSADPGFDRRNLILFGVRPGTSGYAKPRLESFYFNLQQRLAATPGVAAVGLASVRPMNIGGWWDGVRLAGLSDSYNASINGVTPTYLPLYTSRMIAGRNIQWADVASGANVAVISEDLARRLGGASVLGRRLVFFERPAGEKPPEFEIVGIAPAIAPTSLKDRPYVVWLPLRKDSPEVTVVLRTLQPPQFVLPAIRQAIREIDPNLPMVEATTMEEQISKGLQRERMFATLCDGFGVLALVLSVVGLYGVTAYRTSRRRGEIGVRQALGALPRAVIWMVLREGMRLAAGGLLVGMPVIWLSSRYLEKELFRMKPLEPGSLLLATATLLMAALLAAAIPAWQASRVAPAEALRRE